jgi:hypothetical protein
MNNSVLEVSQPDGGDTGKVAGEEVLFTNNRMQFTSKTHRVELVGSHDVLLITKKGIPNSNERREYRTLVPHKDHLLVMSRSVLSSYTNSDTRVDVPSMKLAPIFQNNNATTVVKHNSTKAVGDTKHRNGFGTPAVFLPSRPTSVNSHFTRQRLDRGIKRKEVVLHENHDRKMAAAIHAKELPGVKSVMNKLVKRIVTNDARNDDHKLGGGAIAVEPGTVKLANTGFREDGELGLHGLIREEMNVGSDTDSDY